jgi:hypothetical protein
MVSRFSVETPMDDMQVYEMFNNLRLSSSGREFKTPVVIFSENSVEIEAVPINAVAKRAAAPRPKPRNPALAGNRGGGRGGGYGGGGGGRGTGGTALAAKAKVTLQLKPAKFGN